MLNQNFEWFEFGGRNSQEMGLFITDKTTYDGAERDIEMIEVPGRDGSLAIDNGNFKNVKIEYTLKFMDNSPLLTGIDSLAVLRATREIKSWLLSLRGYQKLRDSYDPESYRMAIFDGGVIIKDGKSKLGKTFEISVSFTCKPFSYLLSGEKEILITESGTSVINPSVIEALPKIRVYGTGACAISIGTSNFGFTDLQGYDDIDSELMTVNNYATGNDSENFVASYFPVIRSGENKVVFTGNVSRIEIIPRWRIL